MGIILVFFLWLLIIVFILLLIWFTYNVVFNHFIPTVFFGAPFVKTPPDLAEKILLLSDVKPWQKVVDLGSGDGRLVIALAKLGVKSYGYEINPFLVLLSRIKIKRAGLDDKAFVYWGNFWQKNLSEFDVIVLYGISFIMNNLEVKLQKELKSGAKIISNYFRFSHWASEKQEGSICLYIK